MKKTLPGDKQTISKTGILKNRDPKCTIARDICTPPLVFCTLPYTSRINIIHFINTIAVASTPVIFYLKMTSVSKTFLLF